MDNEFDACWKCGTTLEGQPAPEFKHADKYLPEVPGNNRQFNLANMFFVTTSFALAVAGATTQSVILLILGVALLALSVGCWIIPYQIRRWLRRSRS